MKEKHNSRQREIHFVPQHLIYMTA